MAATELDIISPVSNPGIRQLDYHYAPLETRPVLISHAERLLKQPAPPTLEAKSATWVQANQLFTDFYHSDNPLSVIGRQAGLTYAKSDKYWSAVVGVLAGLVPLADKPAIERLRMRVKYHPETGEPITRTQLVNVVETKPTALPTVINEELEAKRTQAILISRAQAGDHSAFESIFNQYQTAIYNYIYRLMSSSEDAYDMTQDTFLKAYLAIPRTSDDLRVGAWLYRIATNVCMDELRHRKLVKWQPWESFISVFHPSQVAKDSPERDTIDRENTEEVQLILGRLHPRYRMTLILREYHDLSYDEIADVLSTTRAAVKSNLFRAREQFRQVYAQVERQPGRARG